MQPDGVNLWYFNDIACQINKNSKYRVCGEDLIPEQIKKTLSSFCQKEYFKRFLVFAYIKEVLYTTTSILLCDK